MRQFTDDILLCAFNIVRSTISGGKYHNNKDTTMALQEQVRKTYVMKIEFIYVDML